MNKIKSFIAGIKKAWHLRRLKKNAKLVEDSFKEAYEKTRRQQPR